MMMMNKKLLKFSRVFMLCLVVCCFSQAVRATALSGTYTIDPSLPATGSNFKNLASAVAYLTGNGTRTDGGTDNTAPFGISASVTFNIASGTYNEILYLDGNTIPGISTANRIAFNGAGAQATQIIYDTAAAVVNIAYCDFVTLSNLGVINMNTESLACGVMILGDATTSLNGTGCRITKCFVDLKSIAYGSEAVSITDINRSTWSSAPAMDSVMIDSNEIRGGDYALMVYGANSSLKNKGFVFRNNNIYTEASHAIMFSKVNNGIHFLYNTVSNEGKVGPTVQTNDLIKFSYCNNTGPAQHRVIGNKLSADTRALGIEYCAGVQTAQFEIYNNMIRARILGINILLPSQANYFRIYHNTVYIENPLMGRFVPGICLSYYPFIQNGISCKNNLLVVKPVADSSLTSAADISKDTIAGAVDFNVYSNPLSLRGKVMQRKDSAYTEAFFRQPYAGGDSSSSTTPSFISATDLHLSNGCQFRGTDLTAFVPFDIDGNPRSTQPYAGCDEYLTGALDLSVTAIDSPSFPIDSGNYNVQVQVRNTGTTPVSSFTVSYQLNGETPVSKIVTEYLLPCASTTVRFDGADQLVAGNNAATLRAYVSNPDGMADDKPENDTLLMELMRGTYTIGDSTSDFATFSDALNALYTKGMSGAVTFVVKPGTYTGQLYVNGTKIKGLSSSNTLTFDGQYADSTILTANIASQATVVIHYAKNITFRNFTINNTSTSQAVGAAIVGSKQSASFNGTGCSIRSCKISVAASNGVGISLTSSMNGNGDDLIQGDSLVIDGNHIRGGRSGIRMNGSLYNSSIPVTYNQGTQISNNIIEDAGVMGIELYDISVGIDVINNRIYGTQLMEAGILVYGCMNPALNGYPFTISGNRVEAKTRTAIHFQSAFGITPGAPYKVYNNYVTNAQTGLNIDPGPTVLPNNIEVYHNTFNMNMPVGSKPSVNSDGRWPGYGIYFANNTSATVKCVNNIFAVTTTSGVNIPAYFKTSPGVGTLNFNTYYNAAGPVLLQRGATMYTEKDFNTLVAGGDSSLHVKPEWVSDTDFHLLKGCEMRGTDLSFILPADIDGTPHPARPSHGCSEFISGMDDVTIDSVQSSLSPFAAGMQDLRIKVRNNGSNVITTFVVEYELNGASPVSYMWSGTLLPCGTTEVIFPSITLATQNNLKVFTSLPNGFPDLNVLNDTFRTEMSEALNGTYIIGAAPADFATFNEAVEALVARGISGPVVMRAKSGVYTEQVELSGKINGISAANTITFNSLAGDHDSVLVQYQCTDAVQNFVLKFNSISHVTIQDISFKALDTANAKVVEFVGLSSFNTLENCSITANIYDPPFGTYPGEKAGVYAYFFGGGGNIIRNNVIEYGRTGIAWYGISVFEQAPDNTFEGNTIRNTTICGIDVFHNRRVRMRNNDIVVTNGSKAINCTSCNESMEITGNSLKITNGGYGMTLVACNAVSQTPGLIANNVVLISGTSGTGINVSQGQYQHFYHNSILAKGSASPLNLNFAAQANDNLVMNNILVNKGTGNAMNWMATGFSNQSDYNLFSVAGTTLIQRNVAPANMSNLSIWQTASGMDLHSVSASPNFVNDTNLHMVGKTCYKTAPRLTEVMADQEGIVRYPLTVMGAYEYTGTGDDIAVDKLIQPSFPVSTGVQDMVVRLRNEGRSVISDFNISYAVNNGIPVTKQWTGLLNGCDTTTVTFDGADQVTVSGNMSDVLKAYTDSPNGVTDADKTNDTLTLPLVPALNGPYTLGGPGADFANFKAVETALKTRGISGPVTFNVPSGLVFREVPVIISAIPGNNLYPVTFIKTGTGANPVLYGLTGTGTTDAVITLRGVNHVTFDGIDVSDTSTNTTPATRMEYGYKVMNAEVNEGSSFNVIRNCKITLNRTNTSSIGILQTATTTGGAYVPVVPSGANHNNRYENIKVTNSYNGILLTGTPAVPDSANVITSAGNDTTTIGLPVSNDIGNGSTAAYGIQLINQKNAEISDCIIRNITSTNTNVYGIYLVNTQMTSNYGNTVIRGNRIYNIRSTSTTGFSIADGVYGIRVEININATATVSNNVVYNLTRANMSTVGNYIFLRGISHSAEGWGGSAAYYNNTVSIDLGTSLNISSAAFFKDGPGLVTIQNNALINRTGAQSGNARHFSVFYNQLQSNGTLYGSNNLLWSAGANGFIGGRSTSYAATLTDWKTLTGQEAKSISYLPVLSATDHLKPVASDSSTWALNGRALHLDSTIAKTDINRTTRPLTKADGVPDIGAYEFTPTSLPPAATAVGALAQGSTQVFLFGEDTVARVKWNGAVVPPSIDVRQYTGTKPTGISGAEPFMYFYTRMDADQSVAYDFDLDLVYQDAWLGTVTSEPNLRMAQTQANTFWAMTDASGTSVDTVLNIITALHLDTFSLFTGTDMNTPLPVSMIAFEGKLQSDDVQLKWITASETNNKGFAVERSADGKRWTYIGFVNGMGNTNTKQYYNYTDRTPFSSNIPVLHYRLRQVDVNGKTSYSDIVSVRKNAGEMHSMSVYPNPFDNAFTLSVDALNNGALLIELYDIQGRLVESFTKTVNKGSNHVLVNNLDHLQQGVYFIKTTIDRETGMRKLIRQ